MQASNDPRTVPDLTSVGPLVRDFHDAAGQPGLAYGVVAGGELVLSGGAGARALGGPVPDADTVFRIASMTKSFTAATVLLLRDEGLLRLDDEVAGYVPEAAALRPPTDDAAPITIRSLLTMTAGLPTDDPWGDRRQDLPDDDFARLLAGGLSFTWTPGTAYEYSNLGYALLGRVIAAASGRPYAELVTERLLTPLGMTSTVYTADAVPAERLALGYRAVEADLEQRSERSEQREWQQVPFAGYGAFAPMGGLFSSVRDLARWVAGFTDAYPPRDGEPVGGHPLRRASRREQQQPHYALPAAVTWTSVAAPPAVRSVGYGFGLVVEHDAQFGTLVSHSGGYPGFGSHMRWHPASGLGVIVLANSTYAGAGRLGTQLLDALLAANPAAGRPPGAAPPPAPASGSMGAATAAARRDVTRLISGWDDALAADLFADNVDADEPLPLRRAGIERLVKELGPFGPLEPDPEEPVTSSSPAQCTWWLRGAAGRIRVEIRLTPQSPPLVQTLTVTGVPNASPRMLAAAELVAERLGHDDPGVLEGLPLAAGADRPEVIRQLRAGGSWAGRSTVSGVLAGDGSRDVTFRLTGGRLPLQLRLIIDHASTDIAVITLTPL